MHAQTADTRAIYQNALAVLYSFHLEFVSFEEILGTYGVKREAEEASFERWKPTASTRTTFRTNVNVRTGRSSFEQSRPGWRITNRQKIYIVVRFFAFMKVPVGLIQYAMSDWTLQ